MNEPAKIIKYIRKRIPVFECILGCTDCCGPVPFSKWGWSQIRDKRDATSIICPYVTEVGCAIYSQRPILCRLFGTVFGMRCPHGRGPKNLLSSERERELMALYSKIMDA